MFGSLACKLNDMRIVLASGSEPRANLLRATKINFEIYKSNFKENLDPKQHTYSDYVEKTALGKVNDVWEQLKNDEKPPDLIIGVDTMVAHNGRMYGKPKDTQDAIKTITELTRYGIPHFIYSGVVVKYHDKIHKFTEVSTVHMAQLTDEEIQAYVSTGEPMGRAGSYAIQGIASTFVKRIEGDCNNIIGLPLCRLIQVLKQIII